jgi:uncharacterized protein
MGNNKMKRVFSALNIIFCFLLLTFSVASQTIDKSSKFSCKLTSEDKEYLDITLRAAITANDKDCVKILLEKGVNPNFNFKYFKGTSPIVIASDEVDVEITELLLKHGVDVNGEDAKTALSIATQRGNFDLVKVLLKGGVKPNGKLKDDATVLMVSASMGFSEIVKLLIEFGAEINAKTTFGATSLMLSDDNSEIVKLLLKNGAKIDFTDENRRTAVFYAIENCQILKLDVLLQSKANINLKDKKSVTPLMLAEQIKDSVQKEKIIKLLKKYGA